jgi:hypothetical protein
MSMKVCACCGAALGFGVVLGAALPHPLLMIIGAIACVGFTIMGLNGRKTESKK